MKRGDRAGQTWVDVLDDAFLVVRSEPVDIGPEGVKWRHRVLVLDGPNGGKTGSIEEHSGEPFEGNTYMARIA